MKKLIIPLLLLSGCVTVNKNYYSECKHNFYPYGQVTPSYGCFTIKNSFSTPAPSNGENDSFYYKDRTRVGVGQFSSLSVVPGSYNVAIGNATPDTNFKTGSIMIGNNTTLGYLHSDCITEGSDSIPLGKQTK